MGRGKIEIKKIENSTNRQVTYSKRRNGIIKKAKELTVLCDAKISLLMLSSTRKFHEYTSPNTTQKKMIDQYQRTLGVDIWSPHYEKMQENLKRLKEINNKLRREIRQRTGEDMSGLNLQELCLLQENISESLAEIRERKYHVIKTQTDTFRKKVKNLEEQHGNLVLDLETKSEDPKYGVVENEGQYNSAMAFANGVHNLYAFRLQSLHPNLQNGGEYGSRNLRLA
ncbi:PREDICTED: floral homeotic protein DEFICIENS-like [Nicotiana attenuata]|uniref:floral homeotic protein DEFICIENS-like n=1 Tax=Nicotiana attenuata TaxID=49451 RepID=UPI000905CBB7|nr:PREDICTED: floral homeotic protein DEFICIENS-like [Nicotiana attenuata]